MDAGTKMARKATAIAPGQSSSNPCKDQKMNEATHTTGAATAPDVTLIENPLNEATRMASILSGLIEGHFKDDMSSLVGPRGRDSYHAIKDEIEDMLFSVYQVQGALSRIEQAVQEVLNAARSQ